MTDNEIAEALKVLGCLPGSSLKDASAAWKSLAKTWHPDMYEAGTDKHKEAVDKQKEFNQAIDVLRRADAAGKLPKESLAEKAAAAGAGANGMDGQYEKARNLEKACEVLQAMDIYKRLAQMGHAKSQFRLGFIYFDSVMKDMKQAYNWWHRAAEQGHVLAQYNLGLMYEQGLSVPLDLHQAEHWFREAAKRGDQKAQAKLRQLGAVASARIVPSPSSAAASPASAIDAELAAKLAPASPGLMNQKPKMPSEEAGRSFLSGKKNNN